MTCVVRIRTRASESRQRVGSPLARAGVGWTRPFFGFGWGAGSPFRVRVVGYIGLPDLAGCGEEARSFVRDARAGGSCRISGSPSFPP